MPRRQLTWEERYVRCEKQRRYAWARFYELAHNEHNRDYDHYRVIVNVVKNTEELNEFVKKQLIEMGAELKKTWECPICLEFIEKDNLDISPCGHYYCKGCFVNLKKQVDDNGFAKCAVCRHKLRGDGSDESA